MKKLILALLACSCMLQGKTQIKFQNVYGGVGFEDDYCNTGDGNIIELSGGGYAMTNGGQLTPDSPRDIFLIRTNAAGDTLWTKAIGDSAVPEYGNSLIETMDGKIAVAFQGDAMGILFGLMKTDLNGNILWSKRYFEGNAEFAASVRQVESDSGYVVVGAGAVSSGSTVALVRTDKNGNVIWGKIYKLPAITTTLKGYDLDLNQTGIIVSGTGDTGSLLLKVDMMGNIVWARQYQFGSSAFPRFTSVCTLADGYVVTGGYMDGSTGMTLVKTDLLGNPLWVKTYEGDYCRSIQTTPDNGFVLAGAFYTGSNAQGYLVKTDAGGNVDWASMYGGIEDDILKMVLPTADGGYVSAGFTNSYGAGYTDIYVVKTDGTGNSMCNHESYSPVVSTMPVTTDTLVLLTVNATTSSNYPVVVRHGIGFTELCTTLSADESSADAIDIDVFPNPLENTLTIRGMERPSQIVLRNIDGQVVKTETVGQNTREWDVRGLSPGTYLLTVVSEGQTRASTVLVKNQ